MKKFISLVLIFVFLFNFGSVYTLADTKDVNVYIDGVKIDFDVKPIIDNGRTLVPIRAISEYLKYEVSWNNEKQEAEIKNDGNVMVIGLNRTKYTKNGEEKEMDVSAKLINGRTLVPVRLISESFGCKVDWDNETFSVYIKTLPIEEEIPAENVWTPDFSDYSTGSINNPFCANLIYIGEDVKKPIGYNFEFEYLEYQPSDKDEIKKLKIKSTRTIDDKVALKFLKNEVKGVDYNSLKPADGQTWWIHKITINYIDGTDKLNINELLNADNLYLKTGEIYETIKSFIVYEKKVYDDSVLELEKRDEGYVIYLCTLINRSSKDPLLRILYDNGEKGKYFHLNSYTSKTAEEQLGIKEKSSTQNDKNNVGNNYNNSIDSNKTLENLKNERARLVAELNSSLAANMGRESSYTRNLRNQISRIDEQISSLK